MMPRNGLRIALLAVLFGAGACGSSSKPPPPATMVLAGLVGDPPTAVEVEIENLPPTQRIERVFLVDRRGTEVEASRLERRAPQGDRGPDVLPQVSVGIGGGVRSSVGIGVPLGSSEEPEARSSVTTQIPLPDPEAYLAAPDDWTVVVKGRDRRGLPVTYRVPAPRRPGTTYQIPATRASQPPTP
ncbi:MAG: hypothetical protein QNJ30_22385 [Kiloniellales bacterium]|nr:hypothetical protein [Kiloniellales bacterium]